MLDTTSVVDATTNDIRIRVCATREILCGVVIVNKLSIEAYTN